MNLIICLSYRLVFNNNKKINKKGGSLRVFCLQNKCVFSAIEQANSNCWLHYTEKSKCNNQKPYYTYIIEFHCNL